MILYLSRESGRFHCNTVFSSSIDLWKKDVEKNEGFKKKKCY